jgi:hypothetical protein
VGFWADVGGATGLEVEGVVEGFFEAGEGERLGVDGDSISILYRVGAKVVEACDVVGMAMGVEDSIEVWDGGAEGLGTKIGGGIDDDAEGAFFDPDRGAKSAVAWVGGGADAAGAGEEGDALGSSGT